MLIHEHPVAYFGALQHLLLPRTPQRTSMLWYLYQNKHMFGAQHDEMQHKLATCTEPEQAKLLL